MSKNLPKLSKCTENGGAGNVKIVEKIVKKQLEIVQSFNLPNHFSLAFGSEWKQNMSLSCNLISPSSSNWSLCSLSTRSI